MSDIFISYAREDHGAVERLAHALVARGWTVFWDQTIPAGKTWREVIGNQLDAARCVVVVWSKNSIVSEWVLEEADVGKERGVLVPVLIEQIRAPLGFRNVQAADLSDWDGTIETRSFAQLLADLSRIPGLESDAHAGSASAYREDAKSGALLPERTTPSANEVSPDARTPSARDSVAELPALFAPPTHRVALLILLAALFGSYFSPRVGGLTIQFISLQIMAVAYLGYRYGRRIGLIAGVLVFLPQFLGHVYGYAGSIGGDAEQKAAWQGTMFAGMFRAKFGAFRTYGVAYLYLALVGAASAVLKERLSLLLRGNEFAPREGYAPLSVSVLVLFVIGGYLVAQKISIGPLSIGGENLGFLLPMILVYRYGPIQAWSAIRLLLPAVCVSYAGGAFSFGYGFSSSNIVLVCLSIVALACITHGSRKEGDPSAQATLWVLMALLVVAGSWEFRLTRSMSLYAAWVALPLVMLIGSRYGARSGYISGITWGWANIVGLYFTQTLVYGAPTSFLIAAPVFGYLAGLTSPRRGFLANGAILLACFYLVSVVGRFALTGFSVEYNLDELISMVIGFIVLLLLAPLARSSDVQDMVAPIKGA